MPVVRMIMGIDADRGVLAKHFVTKAFNSEHMVQFYRILSNATWQRTCIFMDNAPWRSSHKSLKELKRLHLKPIFNKPYNPEYNPIESIFATIKTIFRKLRLRSIANNQQTDPMTLIRRAVNFLDKKGVTKTIVDAIKMWRLTPEWQQMLIEFRGKTN